jgi:hypothetical protein
MASEYASVCWAGQKISPSKSGRPVLTLWTTRASRQAEKGGSKWAITRVERSGARGHVKHTVSTE